MLWPEIVVLPQPSLRAQRSNPCHEGKKEWIASSQGLLAMTVNSFSTRLPHHP
jgi:hypothetical protein